jgi:acetylornithine deacetylase
MSTTGNLASSAAMTPAEMLEKLVAFDTTSALSNLALIDFVADWLARHGVASTRIFDAGKTKANLFATIGPTGDGGVALSGHTDVVPVTGQHWTSDPFTLRHDATEGRLYGRGSADMKGFIACVLAKLPAFCAAPLKQPLHIALSYDEEVGCIGIGGMIAGFGDGLPKPFVAIIGEPTSMQIVNAHKGLRAFRVTLDGVAAHSSAPQRGVSAIAYAAEIITHITALAAELRQQADADCGFHPPYPTFNIGHIQGGEALNIIPEQCRFVWEFRPLPETDADAIEARIVDFIENDVAPRMHAENPAAGVQIELLPRVPPLARHPDSPAEKLVRHLTGANDSVTVAYTSEASQFQGAGVPAVLCGPGNIDQAHQADEWIAESQLVACSAFLDRLIEWAVTDGKL